MENATSDDAAPATQFKMSTSLIIDRCTPRYLRRWGDSGQLRLTAQQSGPVQKEALLPLEIIHFKLHI